MLYYNAHNYVTIYLTDSITLDLDSVLPVAGSISLDVETMCMLFNTADVGKSVTVDCTRFWNT